MKTYMLLPKHFFVCLSLFYFGMINGINDFNKKNEKTTSYYSSDNLLFPEKNNDNQLLSLNTSNIPTIIQSCGDLYVIDYVLQQNVSEVEIESIEVYDTNNDLVTSAIINESGTYQINIKTTDGNEQQYTTLVTILPTPNLTVQTNQVFLQMGELYSFNATSNNGAIINYYDATTNLQVNNNIGPFTTPGTYTYKAVAKLGTCETTEFITVVVTDTTICTQNAIREYATIAKGGGTLLGIVTNPNNAANSDTETYATLTLSVGLLGLTSSYLDLIFENPVPAGKPIIIKLGSNYGGLDVLSGATLTTIIENQFGNKVTSGVPQSIQANLLGLLNGKNEYEVVFNPNPTNPERKVYGVRIRIAAAVSVAQNLNVYNAYYDSDVINTDCESEIIDVLSGTKGYGVNIANATVGVNNPRNIISNDITSYSQMYVGVGVLAEAYLMPVYSNYSSKEDVIEMIVSNPNGVLSLSLLSALTYQKFDHQTPVSSLNPVDANVLSLELLSGSSNKYILRIKDSNTQGAWDRFELRLGAVANVLDIINIYSIKRLPHITLENNPDISNLTFCVGEQITVNSQECTTYKWYRSETDNDVLSNTNTFVIPENMFGQQTVYIQAIRNGCETLARFPININVKQALSTDKISLQASLDSINKCSGNVKLSAILDNDVVINNPKFQWFKLENDQQILIENESNNIINLNNLDSGNYTYYVGVGSDEYCFTPELERIKVDFTIPRLTTEADFTSVYEINECDDLTVTINPNQELTNVTYKWYFNEDGSEEITNGVKDGITYKIIDNNLIVSGLPAEDAQLNYYVTIASNQTCYDLLNLIPISVDYQAQPDVAVLQPGDQVFCESVQTTLADIRLNTTHVIWYDALTNGNVLPDSTILQDGATYYAIKASKSACENATLLPVKVSISNVPAPNLATVQSFCEANQPQIKNLDTNNYLVVWKDENNVVLSEEDYLENGKTYYAYHSPVENCESLTATAVTVTLNSQQKTIFKNQLAVCESSANLQSLLQIYNGDWYVDAAMTNKVTDSDKLVPQQTYYALNFNLVTCENISYEITIVEVPDEISITSIQDIADYCTSLEYTFNATAGFTNYNWQITNATIVDGGKENDDFVTVAFNSTGQNTVGVSVNDAACLTNNSNKIDVVVVNCSPISEADLGVTISSNNLTPYYLNDVVFTLKVSNLSAYNFTDVVVDFALASGFEYKSYQTNTGTFNRKEWIIPEINIGEEVVLTLTAKVLETGSHYQEALILSSDPVDLKTENNFASIQLQPVKNDCLVVYNEISPNGDGVNDNFIVSCIDKYPNTKLHIYNRYGNLVYKSNNYNNSFNGYANVSGTFAGNELPSGTYFYTIEFADGTTEKKSGWLYIMR